MENTYRLPRCSAKKLTTKVCTRLPILSALLKQHSSYSIPTGATFTARMQPLIEPGGQMELYFSCADLVQMWVVKTFGHPKSLTSPTPYVLVKEKNEVSGTGRNSCA
jgi:hypothetical protein